jgi:hypothetical protein
MWFFFFCSPSFPDSPRALPLARFKYHGKCSRALQPSAVWNKTTKSFLVQLHPSQLTERTQTTLLTVRTKLFLSAVLFCVYASPFLLIATPLLSISFCFSFLFHYTHLYLPSARTVTSVFPAARARHTSAQGITCSWAKPVNFVAINNRCA